MLVDSSQSSRVLDGQRRALRAATQGAPLRESLDTLVLTLEQNAQRPILASILLVTADGLHLREGAAPSLPRAYNAAIDGIAIGPDVGSCGTAAFTGRPVIVSDIQADPLWKNFRAVAATHGLRACWSVPFHNARRRVLGTFAIYHREPASPTVADLDLVNVLSQTASVLVERASEAAPDAKGAAVASSSSAPSAIDVQAVAREKIAAILGPVEALRLIREVVAELGIRLDTPDDLLRFADHLADRKGFEGAVGALLSVTAMMHGAKRPQNGPAGGRVGP